MKWHLAKLVTLGAAAALLASAADSAGDVVGDSGDHVAAVRKAWADRQARVKSGKFVIAQKRTITKGARTPSQDKQKQKGIEIPKGLVIPPEDTTYDMPVVIAFDRERYRYQYADKMWMADKQQYVDRTYVSTCNDDACKSWYSTTRKGWPQGQICPATKPTDLDGPMFPVLFTYRASNPHGALAKRGPLIEQPKCLIDGRECLAFALGRHNNNHWKEVVYVDAAMDYSIVRHSETVQGVLRSNADIRYRRTADFGWVPSGWDFTRNPGDAPILTAAEVTEYSLNKPLPRDLFDIQFPPGTMVIDERPRQKPELLLIKPSGEVRPVPPEDFRATPQQLLDSEPGQAFAPRPRASYTPWVFAALGVIAFLLAYRFWTRPGRKGP